jgi:hypothetical protein
VELVVGTRAGADDVVGGDTDGERGEGQEDDLEVALVARCLKGHAYIEVG